MRDKLQAQTFSNFTCSHIPPLAELKFLVIEILAVLAPICFCNKQSYFTPEDFSPLNYTTLSKTLSLIQSLFLFSRLY